MEHFVTIERAIACPRASVAVAAETAAQVLGAAGYRRGLGLGPTASYVRAYRPSWVVTVALFAAVPTLGLSLLLLKYRIKDHCNIVIEDGPYGVVALVSGRVPDTLPEALESASGQYVEEQYGGGGQQPPPMLLSPAPGQEGSPSHTPQAILRPATPVPRGEEEYSGSGYGFPGHATPHPDSPYGGPSFDPYPAPGRTPVPVESQSRPEPPFPAPGPVRPPSKLAPPLPADSPRERPQPGPVAPAVGSSQGSGAASDDEQFSSTSGRVSWTGGGRPGPLPAPPGPAPVSPISRPPGRPPLAGNPTPGPASAPSSDAGTPYAPTGPSGAPQAAPGRVATAAPEEAYVMRVDSGEALDLGPFCLLGREPVARDGDPPAQLVRFDDPKLSVSKTHIAYGVDQQGVWVMDRNSTNGTTIIDPSGRRMTCAPGNRQYLSPGYQIQIGQRRITVESFGSPSA
ncbi:MAG: hypothetical protein QG622_1699 [Actinomycetota bacterium]|nr:hypothetical protein [Actinomycetota bacterium]